MLGNSSDVGPIHFSSPRMPVETCTGWAALGLEPTLGTGDAIVQSLVELLPGGAIDGQGPRQAAAEGRGPAMESHRHHVWEMTGKAGKGESHWQRTAGPRDPSKRPSTVGGKVWGAGWAGPPHPPCAFPGQANRNSTKA